MYLIGIQVNLRLFAVDSLKEKRKIIRSIIDHVKNRYKITAAEVEHMDNHNLASLGFGIVSNNQQNAQKILQQVINYMDTRDEFEILNIDWLEA